MQEVFEKLKGIDIFSLKSYIEPTNFPNMSGVWAMLTELFVNCLFFLLNLVVGFSLYSFAFSKISISMILTNNTFLMELNPFGEDLQELLLALLKIRLFSSFSFFLLFTCFINSFFLKETSLNDCFMFF